jgi:DNA-binding MarR family transcriptional regulator
MNKIFDKIKNKKRIEVENKTEKSEQDEQGKIVINDMHDYWKEKNKKNYVLTEIQFKILKCYRENKQLTQSQVAEKLGIPQNKVSYNLSKIQNNNPELAQEIMSYDKRTKYRIFRL